MRWFSSLIILLSSLAWIDPGQAQSLPPTQFLQLANDGSGFNTHEGAGSAINGSISAVGALTSTGPAVSVSGSGPQYFAIAATSAAEIAVLLLGPTDTYVPVKVSGVFYLAASGSGISQVSATVNSSTIFYASCAHMPFVNSDCGNNATQSGNWYGSIYLKANQPYYSLTITARGSNGGTGGDGIFGASLDPFISIDNSSALYSDYSLQLSPDAYPLVQNSVPEPASWTMMITGFGMVGYLRRRRTNWRVSLRSKPYEYDC